MSIDNNLVKYFGFELPKYTFDDWLELPPTDRFELINGEYVPLAGYIAPNYTHGAITALLASKFVPFMRRELCQITCGCGVRFDEAADYFTYVPDISILCKKEQMQRAIQDGYITGGPDLIVDIISKFSREYIFESKFQSYQEYGVKEYWIIDPIKRVVDVFDWHTSAAKRITYDASSAIKVGILENCVINVSDIFI